MQSKNPENTQKTHTIAVLQKPLLLTFALAIKRHLLHSFFAKQVKNHIP